MDKDLFICICLVAVGGIAGGTIGAMLEQESYIHKGRLGANVEFVCNKDFSDCVCFNIKKGGEFNQCPISFKRGE